MSARALISVLGPERRCVLLDDEGRLIDVLLDPGEQNLRLGDIFRARGTGRDRGLSAVFVDLGPGLPALLQAEAEAGDLPQEGQRVTVRVTRTPSPGKGAKVKLVRHAIEDSDSQSAALPRLVTPGEDPLVAMLHRRLPVEILCDDAETARNLSAVMPKLESALRVVQPPVIPQDAEEALDALLLPDVALSSGGSLVIEPTRAMVAVDVNSASHGASLGGGGRRALDVNIEAAAEIARQLRLRSLSGLVVIDFLAVPAPKDRETVREVLKVALAEDPETTRVFRMSPSGLLEMTRRRSRPALHELLTCQGPLVGGGRLSPHACAMAALRALQASPPSARHRLMVSCDVGEVILGGSAQPARRRLQQRLGVEITVEVEDARDNEEWELLFS